MPKHPTTVERFDGTLEELAREIARLRYDSFDRFIEALAKEVQEESRRDRAAGKRRLSLALEGASAHLASAQRFIKNAWCISKPHMKEELAPP